MTDASGIKKILPKSEICDFDFDPYGYSMNSIEGGAVSTIHVTPKDGFSCASFETVSYDFEKVDLTQLMERVLECFNLAKFFVAVRVSVARNELDSAFKLDVGRYGCAERRCVVLGDGGSIIYWNFTNATGCGSPKFILHCCWSESEDEDDGRAAAARVPARFGVGVQQGNGEGRSTKL